MTLLPKNLLMEGNKLYTNTFKNKKINELNEGDIQEYNILRDKLIEHTKNHLTTDKMAEYILKKTNFESVEKILYLSGNISPDYLRCVTLHGFKSLIGSDCHDYPKVPHIYKSNNINYESLYGKGMTYTNLLDPKLHNDNLDATIIDNIKNKYYDIVIYGSYHRGMPYYNLISKIYKSNEIILLCGEDLHICNYNNAIKKGHPVFVREL